MCHFSPAIFRTFWLLFLVFRNIVMTCLGMHFFGFILPGFFSASYTCRFMSFAKLGKFQPLLLQILFESHLLPLLRLQWYTCWIFCHCAWGSIHFFFQPIFFLLRRWVNSIFCSQLHRLSSLSFCWGRFSKSCDCQLTWTLWAGPGWLEAPHLLPCLEMWVPLAFSAPRGCSKGIALI